MRKLHLSIFVCFTVAVLAFSVLTTGVTADETSKKSKSSKPTTESSSKSTNTNAKVDLNTGSEKDLESLPGVGSATAKKIMAGRPYSSVDDLSKAGVSASTIKKIAPLVTVSSAAASAPTKACNNGYPSYSIGSETYQNSQYECESGSEHWKRKGFGKLAGRGFGDCQKNRGRSAVFFCR